MSRPKSIMRRFSCWFVEWVIDHLGVTTQIYLYHLSLLTIFPYFLSNSIFICLPYDCAVVVDVHYISGYRTPFKVFQYLCFISHIEDQKTLYLIPILIRSTNNANHRALYNNFNSGVCTIFLLSYTQTWHALLVKNP